MAELAEYRCFVGGLAWATDDSRLETAFRPYGEVVESKVPPLCSFPTLLLLLLFVLVFVFSFHLSMLCVSCRFCFGVLFLFGML
jgi:hypothetical protein